MVTQKNSNTQRDLRLSLADLEAMRTHDLAELLSNFVLLLRRLPDVPFSELGQLPTTEQSPSETIEPTRIDFVSKARDQVNGRGLPDWTGKE